MKYELYIFEVTQADNAKRNLVIIAQGPQEGWLLASFESQNMSISPLKLELVKTAELPKEVETTLRTLKNSYR